MVFQKDSVFPWMRVIDNVEYGLKCRGWRARSVARYRTRLSRSGRARAMSSAPGRANCQAAC